MNALEMITERIREYDDQIEKLGEEKYPEVALLKQVKGVGTLIALTYILTLEDPRRFRKSRDAACYVGLQPGRRSSGQSEPQLHITREEDSYLPMVLVQGAQHILGPLGEDSDLRRWGLKLAERGGKNAKSARSLQCHGSWRSCYTISGSAVRHTSRCTTRGYADWQRHRSDENLTTTSKRRVPATAPLPWPRNRWERAIIIAAQSIRMALNRLIPTKSA